MKNKKIIFATLIILILIIGFSLRIANIETAPPGVYPDEAVNGEDALRALKSENYEWFYTANNGREGLFINFIAFFFKIFGVSTLSLKLPSIIFGTLTIWGVYLLTKELLQKQGPALISAFLTAVSFWPLNFSRIAFRAIMLPAVLVFSSYFIWKGMRTKKITLFFLGGLVFGIGLHTYIAFRIAPVILVIALISFWINKKGFWKNYWKHILVFILGTFLTALPMLYTLWVHPEFLESRSASISILSPEVNQGNLIKTFLRSFSLSLVKYNFWGDQNWRHNYPPYPLLDPLTGLAFLGGIISSIVLLFKSIGKRFKKKKPEPAMNIHVFLLAWFFIMLAPEFMTGEGLPHALRAIGTIVPVMIFSGWFLALVLDKISSSKSSLRKSLLVGFFLLLGFIGIFNTLKYHVFWANKKETAISFEKSLIDISNYLKVLPEEKEKIILTGNMQRVPIKLFNDGSKNIIYAYPGEIKDLGLERISSFYVIMTDRDDSTISFLESIHPEMKLSEIKDDKGLTFYVFKK